MLGNAGDLERITTGTSDPTGARLLDLIADRLRAIAEPSRIRILAVLEQREASVQELADGLGVSHQVTSKHLSVLYRSGIVTRRKEGTCAYYALADYTACLLIRQALTSLAGHVEEMADVVGLER
jgi:DNA-binding transcriptional ArsR family regulator